MAQRAFDSFRFDLRPGRSIRGKYVVEEFLGGGAEGEVYKVVESRTGIRRAAKLFYPDRNERDRAAKSYARKLEGLRGCSLVIQYHHAETVTVRGVPVTCLVSDYVDGVLLSDYVAAHPNGRMHPFMALHVFYQIVCGLEQIHAAGEYHGDLHEHNILIRPAGLFFDIKVVDFYDLGRVTGSHRRRDIQHAIRLLHLMVGGRRHYARQPAAIKAICLGLRRDRINARFPTAARLRDHLERFPVVEVY